MSGHWSPVTRLLLQEKHPASRGLPRKAFRNEVTSGRAFNDNELLKFYFLLIVIVCSVCLFQIIEIVSSKDAEV